MSSSFKGIALNPFIFGYIGKSSIYAHIVNTIVKMYTHCAGKVMWFSCRWKFSQMRLYVKQKLSYSFANCHHAGILMPNLTEI